MDIRDLETQAAGAAKLLKAMSNPHRLLILCQLLNGERRVSELEAIIGLSQSALSQHLARLRSDGLVVTRRESQNIFYSLAGTDVEQVLSVLYRIFCGSPASEAHRATRGGRSRGQASPRDRKRRG